MNALSKVFSGISATFVVFAIGAAACASDPATTTAASRGSGGIQLHPSAPGSGGASSGFVIGLGASSDPTTCEQAASAGSYLGCDFWPTVTQNPVWSIFDFAVVVANTGGEPASVTVTKGGATIATAIVPPSGLEKIYLPWDADLKGADFDTCTIPTDATGSIAKTQGAFHLTSMQPVIVYQFNPLEFRGAGGPPGKNWGSCPGDQTCNPKDPTEEPGPRGCFSFSNDASLLLPATAMTGNYRVTGLPPGTVPGYFAVTGTQDGTMVTVQLGKKANTLAGGGLKTSHPNDVFTFPLNAGDVVEIIAVDEKSDLAGSLVQADHPVQVLAGAACAYIPLSVPGQSVTCDHLEESVLPVETLGKHYIVAPPTGPFGAPTPQAVRLHGSVDGTNLTYPSGMPMGAPATIDAGDSVDLGLLTDSFEIVADHEIAVSQFMPSSELFAMGELITRGDPSQTQAVTVDQFRKNYVFLAPDDFDESFVDIIMPTSATVVLDGAPLPTTATAIGTSGFGVARVRLGPGDGGAHAMSADQPFGIQILGYGTDSSYEYPGGLDLKAIAPPPPPIK